VLVYISRRVYDLVGDHAREETILAALGYSNASGYDQL
jgi:hypothetical protein